MNFLAHDRALGDRLPPLAHVGVALPDLWPLLPVRPLPLLLLRRLRARDDGAAAALAYGIAHHLHADAVFHRHPVFEARVRRATPVIGQAVHGVRHPDLAAHVLVEMLLDRWLLGEEPALPDAYYARFSPVARARACQLSCDEGGSREALAAVLERFVTTRFLAGYATAEGLAFRFLRTLRRIGLLADAAPEAAALAPVLEALDADFAPGSARLLAEVTAGAAARLADAGIRTPPPP